METHAAAKPTHMAATKPAHVAATKATEVTATKAAEVTAGEAARMAKVPAAQPSPAAESEAVVELMMEASPSDKETRTPPIIEAVIRVAPAIVLTGAIVRPIVVVTTVRVTGAGASNHSGRGRDAGMVAVGVTMRAAVGITVGIVMGIKAPIDVRCARVHGMYRVMNGGRRIRGGR